MQILLNGEHREVSDSIVLQHLVEELGLERRTIAIERNREVVPRGAWADTQLAEGDRVEIVHMIGGG